MSQAAAVLARIEAGQPMIPTTSEPSSDATDVAPATPLADGAAADASGGDSGAEASSTEGGAVQPSEPSKAKAPTNDPLAPKFAALSRKEQAVIRREREAKDAIARERHAFEQERQQWQAEKSALEAFRAGKGDPRALFSLLEKEGITARALAEYLASDGTQEATTARELAEMKRQMAEERAERERAAKEYQERASRHQTEAAQRNFLSVATTVEKFPTANALWTPREILSVAHEELQLAQAEGIDLSRVTDDMVAQAVEERAKQRAQKLAALQPNTRENAPGGAPSATPNGSGHPASKAGATKTLTNDQASAGSGPKESDLPRDARVARLVQRLARSA